MNVAIDRKAFVLGVLADLSGQSATLLPRIKDRRFVTLSQDNFDQFFRHKLPERSTLAALRALVNSLGGAPEVVLKVLDVSLHDLRRDLQRAPEFDQSQIFHKVYEELDTLGGQPFNCLIGDYHFSVQQQDIEVLESFAKVAACGRVPFVSSVQPDFLNFDWWQHLLLKKPPDEFYIVLRNDRWETLRACEDANYLFLLHPRFRLSADGDWLNPVYLFGSAVAADASRFQNVFFERENTPEVQQALAHIGINALTSAHLPSADLAQTIRAVNTGPLNKCLVWSSVFHQVKQKLRQYRGVNAFKSTREWLHQQYHHDSLGRFIIPGGWLVLRPSPLSADSAEVQFVSGDG